MNDRTFSILLALLNSGMWQNERAKNNNKPVNEIDSFVVDTAIRLDRTLSTIEHDELIAVETYRCEFAPDGAHILEHPNAACVHCKKKWTGTLWKL